MREPLGWLTNIYDTLYCNAENSKVVTSVAGFELFVFNTNTTDKESGCSN